MDSLRHKKYLHVSRKRFDPLALAISAIGLVAVFSTLGSFHESRYLVDLRSILVVVGGTMASLLFQFDFSAVVMSLWITLRSFLGTPEKPLLQVLNQLDEAILGDLHLEDLREGFEINGEILNDVVFMRKSGLTFEEIEEFITSRLADDYLNRKVAVDLLGRAAIIAPALGLFGTVVGLIGVLKSLRDPSQIGPSMSLALMTTAYGAGLGSLIFTPLAGRIEHHNTIYLETHKQLLSKIGILLAKSDRDMMQTHTPFEHLEGA